MAPFKSSLAKSATKLLGVFRDRDLSLRGFNSSSRNLFFSASGGTKITSGSNVYHVFTSSGSLVVSGGLNKDIELLVVGGGGGTGGTYTGGGGGGGVAHGPSVSVSPGTYPVTVGDGGSSTSTEAGDANSPGGTSSIVLPAGTIRGLGGGTGAIDAFQTYGDTYIHGGSGGGNGDDNSPNSGDATQPGEPNFGIGIVHYGNPGKGPPSGNSPGPVANGGGGGGAGGGGGPTHTDGLPGGVGQPFSNFPAPVIEPAIPSPVRPAWTPTVGPTGIFAGGGTGAKGPTDRVPGGGGGGETPGAGGDGVSFTGGGGGGVNAGAGGDGGKGIVIVKYTA
tara:strand:- start:45 stop:1046 length:1002 start_codon:yes stop_codon:yes gene_type:complete